MLRALVLALLLLMPAQSALACALGPLDWYLRGVALREAGDPDGAAAAIEQARTYAPTDPDLALELARTYAATRRYGDAAAAYREAAVLAPDRLDLALEQARFHLRGAFRVRDGLAAAERAARINPRDPSAVDILDRARTAAALSEGSD